MFSWSKRSVEFMRDASEYGCYYQKLAEHIAPIISNKRVLDAGCGLGYLSLALSSYCISVTAADRERLALDVLRENIAAKNITNIDIFEGDMFAYEPEEKYDAVVFCFFGGVEEQLSLAKMCLKPHGKAIIIKKAWKKHRFTLSGKALSGHTLLQAEEKLNSLNVPFTFDFLELEMGQPLVNSAHAAEFFTIYDADGAIISEADVMDKLVPIEHEKFKYYIPSKKDIGIIVIDQDDIINTQGE